MICKLMNSKAISILATTQPPILPVKGLQKVFFICYSILSLDPNALVTVNHLLKDSKERESINKVYKEKQLKISFLIIWNIIFHRNTHSSHQEVYFHSFKWSSFPVLIQQKVLYLITTAITQNFSCVF